MRKAPVKTKKKRAKPTAPRNIEAAEKKALALKLRKEGLTIREIAERLGYATPSGAQQAIQSALQETVEEPSTEYRELELQRLDLVWKSLLPKIQKGTASAAFAAVEVCKQRARLLGLNAPKGVLVRVERPEGMSDEELLAYCLRTGTPLLPGFADLKQHIEAQGGNGAYGAIRSPLALVEANPPHPPTGAPAAPPAPESGPKPPHPNVEVPDGDRPGHA